MSTLKVALLIGVVILGASKDSVSEELRPPASVHDALSAFERWQSASPGDRYAQGSAVADLRKPSTQLRDWIADSLAILSVATVTQSLKGSFSVADVRSDREWDRRWAEFSRGPSGSGPTLFSVQPVIVSWRQGEREVALVRVDYPHLVAGRWSFGTTAPTIVTKAGEQISKQTLHSECALWTFCVIWETLPGPTANDWPDILLTAGPEGTGAGLTIEQYHFHEETKEWNLIPLESEAGVTKAAYNAGTHEFQIAYFQGSPRWFKVQHGSPAVVVQHVKPKGSLGPEGSKR